jgi:hypothetical protein
MALSLGNEEATWWWTVVVMRTSDRWLRWLFAPAPTALFLLLPFMLLAMLSGDETDEATDDGVVLLLGFVKKGEEGVVVVVVVVVEVVEAKVRDAGDDKAGSMVDEAAVGSVMLSGDDDAPAATDREVGVVVVAAMIFGLFRTPLLLHDLFRRREVDGEANDADEEENFFRCRRRRGSYTLPPSVRLASLSLVR